MSDGLIELQDWAAGLLARLSPAERRRANRLVANAVRRAATARIAAQRNPDGTPYAPRRRAKNLRGKRGHLKRKMFARLRTARYLRVHATTDEALIGFTGRVARIARIHQHGGRDRPAPGAPEVRYAVRRLLGFSPEVRALILDTYAAHLASLER